MRIWKLLLLFYLSFVSQNIQAQICGTPGKDGTWINPLKVLNTYFSPATDEVLPVGSKEIMLRQVGPGPGALSAGAPSNFYGDTPISKGDLLLIIQMQDALINFSNDSRYGVNDPFSGPDRLGGTGYEDLGNSGKYEYILATNSVSLDGGLLTFRGAGTGKGTVNEYTSAAPTIMRGSRTFQVIRVPQFSNLILDRNRINTYMPYFDRRVGGVLVFNVAGSLNLNGFAIDASDRGFWGGSSGRHFDVVDHYARSDVYGQITSGPYHGFLSGKGDGVGGSPVLGFPLGTRGRGAPGNAGGAGYINFAGGGGGGNGGAGGAGGNGTSYDDPRDALPNGGRPGSAVYNAGSAPNRLIPGGGGGGGDVDNLYNASCRPGGGVILINANQITGSGSILSNGQFVIRGSAENDDMNAGTGGGAGGTIFINELHGDLPANVTIEAKGGYGQSVKLNDFLKTSPGPGGAGGGSAANRRRKKSSRPIMTSLLEKMQQHLQIGRASCRERV